MFRIRKGDFVVPVNGIDRLDNKAGYTLQNCRACCSTCNRMKSAMTEAEFIQIIFKIHKNLSSE